MSTRKPRRLDPDMQLQADMLELMGYKCFHRFLFTVMQRSGISAVAYGTEVATSYHEGRRSLGIDILRLADDALSVRSPDGQPFAAMSIAIAEAMRSLTQETETNAENSRIPSDYDDEEPFERR